MKNDFNNTSSTLAETKRLLEQEDEIRKKLKWVNTGFPVMIVAVFIVFFLLFKSSIEDFDQDKFFKRLEHNVMGIYPEMGAEVARVGSALFPHYAEEFEKSLENSIPLIEQSMASEMVILEAGLRDKIATDASKRLLAISSEQQRILQAEMPELFENDAATQQVQKVLNRATVGWIQSIFTQAMEDYAMAFIKLKRTLDKGYRLEGGEKGVIDSEQMLTTWLELMDESLNKNQSLIKRDVKHN